MSSYGKPTAICDGKNFFVDPDWWESLSPEERKGVRLHGDLHIKIADRLRSRGAVLCRCGRKPAVTMVDRDSGIEVPVCAVCMFSGFSAE